MSNYTRVNARGRLLHNSCPPLATLQGGQLPPKQSLTRTLWDARASPELQQIISWHRLRNFYGMMQQDWVWGSEHEDSLALQSQSSLQERGSDMWRGRQRTTFKLLQFLAIYTRHWGQDSMPPRPEKTKSTLSCYRHDLTKAVSGTFLTFTWKINKCLFQGLLKRVWRFWWRGCLEVPEEAQRTKDLVKRETSRDFIQLLPLPKVDRFQAEVNKYLRIWATVHSSLF